MGCAFLLLSRLAVSRARQKQFPTFEHLIPETECCDPTLRGSAIAAVIAQSSAVLDRLDDRDIGLDDREIRVGDREIRVDDVSLFVANVPSFGHDVSSRRDVLSMFGDDAPPIQGVVPVSTAVVSVKADVVDLLQDDGEQDRGDVEVLRDVLEGFGANVSFYPGDVSFHRDVASSRLGDAFLLIGEVRFFCAHVSIVVDDLHE